MAITVEQARGELRIRGAASELRKRAATAELDRRTTGTRLSDIPETTAKPTIITSEIPGPQITTQERITGEEQELRDRPGVISRGFKQFVNKFFVEPARTILSEGGIGDFDTALRLAESDKFEQFKLKTGEKPGFSLRQLGSLIRESNKVSLEAKKETRASVAEAIPGFEVPAAETITEKATDAVVGVTAFLGRLAVTRKFLGVQRGNFAGSVAAWETENIATGGSPGTGAAMRLALGGVDSIPVTTLAGKTLKLGAESSLFAGLTAAAGGEKEDIVMAALIPLGFKAWNASARGVAKTRAQRAIKNLRAEAKKYGKNLDNVSDQALDTIINAGKQASFWNKQRAKGEVTEQVYEQRLAEIRNGVKPITEAIGRQQPIQTTGTEIVKAPEVPTARPAAVARAVPAAKKPGVKAIKPTEIAPKQPGVIVKQIEVSDAEAARLLGESLEKIQADRQLKDKLSKELIVTDFQPSDFVPKSKKGPGLTKAEQKLVVPEVQGKLRFAQTQGLPVGFKAGQKESNDIAKRRLDDFRTARKIEKSALQDARKLVTEYAKDPVVAKKLIISLAKVDSPAKMAAFADKLEEFVKQAETKQKIAEYKTLFKQLKKDNKLGKENFGKLRPAAIKRILEFDETIDLQKLSVAKKEELETLMGTVKDLGVDLSEGVKQLDVDTRDALNQLDPLIDSLDRLQKTALADMGGDEIQVAIDTLKYIVRQNEIENKQIFGKRLVDSRETETKAIAEVSVSKKQKKIFKREAKKGVIAKAKRPGVFAVLKRGTVGQSRTIPTLIQVSTVKGANAIKKVLDDEIWNSFREANRTQFESVDFLSEQYAKHNITEKTYDSFDKEFKVVIGGKSRVVTADDLGGMEMHLRSLDNLEQLRKTEGVWIQGKLVTNFTIKEFVNAVEKLIPSQLKMLDIANVQNRTITAPAINEEFLNLWGYEPATNPNYWAIVRRFKKRVGGFFGINFSKAIEQQSSFQARTGGTKPIVIVPFRQQMWHSIQVGARARTAIAFHNARTLLNSDKWQNAMINAGRENEMNDIIKIFERTQGLSSDKDVLEMAGQGLLSNLSKSILSFRATTPFVQVASFPVSFSEVDLKYAIPLKGHRSQIGKAQLKRLKKFTPTIRLRFEGGRITPEVGNISAADGFKMLVFGKVSLTSKPLVPLRAFDRGTILAIDIMVQRKIKDTTNLQGDAFWEAVSLETERVVRLTQPMWDHFARSVLLTNPNFFLRSIIPFRAPREAMLNVQIRGNDSLAKGDKKQWAKSAGAVSSSLVMARLIKLGIGTITTAILGTLFRGRIPKRRKDVSDFATDLTNDAVGLVPFVGDVVAPAIEFAIEGKTFREVELKSLLGNFVKTAGTVAFDATKAAIQFAKGDTKKAGENFRRALVGAVQVELERRGLPFTGPRDVIKPALKKEKKTDTFGRTRKTRARTTRTRKTRTFGRRKR